MSNEPIHVALAVYDPSGTYSRHAGVVVTSLFEHTKTPVIVHILHDKTLNNLNRERFLKTAERYNQAVDFVDVEGYKNKLSADITASIDKIDKNLTVGTLYRLFMPEVLPELDKIIYLDCDVIVNLDIVELWDINIEDNCLGGVKDPIAFTDKIPLKDRLCMKFNKCNIKEYVNCGVLIMNLKKIREHGELFKIALNWLNRHVHTAHYLDQDALNSIFSGSIKFIDNKFNRLPDYNNLDDDGELNNCIVHFFGGFKPWREVYGSKSEQLYWGTFFNSEWSANDDDDENKKLSELIKIIGKVSSSQFRLHRHTKQCYRHIAHRLKLDILKPEFFETLGIAIQEFIARLKYLFK